MNTKRLQLRSLFSAIKALRTLKKMKRESYRKRILFLHSGNKFIDPLITELIQQGDVVYYLVGDNIHHCNDIFEKVVWNVRSKAKKLNLEPPSEIIDFVSSKAGVDVKEILYPYLKDFVSNVCPEMIARSVSFEKFYIKFKIDFVVGLTSTDTNSMCALISARQLRIKTIGVQHGIEVFDEKIWHMTDIDAFDYYLATDEFSARKYEKCQRRRNENEL